MFTSWTSTTAAMSHFGVPQIPLSPPESAILKSVTFRSKGGFATKEALLGVGVLVLAAAILIPMGLSMVHHSSAGRDVERMRDLYVSLTMYQESAGGEPPPDLTFLSAYQPDPRAYIAFNDPYVTARGPFPVDGGLPNGKRVSRDRISFTYLGAYQTHFSWLNISRESRIGLIADEWGGAIVTSGNFDAKVSGALMRISVDGSLTTTNRTYLTSIGSQKEIFGHK